MQMLKERWQHFSQRERLIVSAGGAMVAAALVFLLIMLAFALVHTLFAKLEWVQSQRVHGRIKVAFAPAIAGGLIGVFMSGCLSPM